MICFGLGSSRFGQRMAAVCVFVGQSHPTMLKQTFAGSIWSRRKHHDIVECAVVESWGRLGGVLERVFGQLS